jgi:hypothetical protein
MTDWYTPGPDMFSQTDPRDAVMASIFDPAIRERGSLLPVGRNAQGGLSFAAPQFLVDMVRSALLPGAAAKGYMATPEDATKAALDMGGAGSVVGKAPAGSLGMFAGRTARTADQAALARAEQMAASGADKGSIWNDTGWFQGTDGKWRFEIDDSGAIPTMSANKIAAEQDGSRVYMGRALKHDQLYDAYPETKTTGIRYEVGTPGAASYAPNNYMVTLEGPRLQGTQMPRDDVILHELQHGVQQIEGFAQGGNTQFAGVPRDVLFDAARKAYEAADGDAALLRELGIEVPNAARPAWDALADRQKLEWLDAGREHIYRRLAGEVEARNVQARMNMTPDQRRATPPWTTEDVPFDQQIIRFLSGQ